LPDEGDGIVAAGPGDTADTVLLDLVRHPVAPGARAGPTYHGEKTLTERKSGREHRPVARQGEPVVHRVRFLELTAEVVAPCRPFGPLLPISLGAYPPALPDAPVDFQVVISPHDRRDRWSLIVGDHLFTGIAGADTAACKAEWCVVTEGLKRLSGFVHVHAAVLATGEQSFMLVGDSGAGKSTMSVALALAGCDLLTDDVGLIDQETLRPATVPRPIKLDQRSTALLEGFGLRLSTEARLGESVARRALPGLRADGSLGPALQTLFFLQPGDRTRTTLTPISEADAVLRLAHHSSTERLAVSDLVGPAFAIVKAVQSFTLAAGELQDTVTTILDAVGAAPPPKRWAPALSDPWSRS
jgi:hypothetical protein